MLNIQRGLYRAEGPAFGSKNALIRSPGDVSSGAVASSTLWCGSMARVTALEVGPEEAPCYRDAKHAASPKNYRNFVVFLCRLHTYLAGSPFMSVIQYTGVQQQRATSSTNGAWTIVLAMQKFATLYCPFWFGEQSARVSYRGRRGIVSLQM